MDLGVEEAFFDVRMCNPFAPSYRSLLIPITSANHEKEKRDHNEESVRKVEWAKSTPLVFAATGRAGELTNAFLKRLAVLGAGKNGEAYCTTVAWLTTRLALSLLRSPIACLRSSRQKVSCEVDDLQPALAIGLAGRQDGEPPK